MAATRGATPAGSLVSGCRYISGGAPVSGASRYSIGTLRLPRLSTSFSVDSCVIFFRFLETSFSRVLPAGRHNSGPFGLSLPGTPGY